jgi:hypothetical protein
MEANELLERYKTWLLDDERSSDDEREYAQEITAEDYIPSTEAVDLLDALGVDYAGARLEWYNCTEIDFNTLAVLADLYLHVYTCEACGETGYYAKVEGGDWDLFQGALQCENVSTIEGEFLGKTFCTEMCDGCISKIETMLGI